MSKHPLRLALLALLSALAASSLSWQRQPGRWLAVGEMRTDVLRPTDPRIRGPFRGPQRVWRFDARAGDHLVVAVESFELDTFLILTDPHGQVIGGSDDSDGFMNAGVAVTFSQAGSYTITVGGTDPEQHGTYRISVLSGDRSRGPEVSSYLARGLRWAHRRRSERAECLVNLAAARRLRLMGEWSRASDCLSTARAAADRSGFAYGRWAVALESGTLAARTMSFGQAMTDLRLALALARRLPESSAAEARVLAQIGDAFLYLDKSVQAEACFRRAHHLAEESGNPSVIARLSLSQVQSSLRAGPNAEDIARKARGLCAWLDPALQVDVGAAHAVSLSASGDLAAALAAIGQTLPEARELAYREAEAALLCSRSIVEFRLGQHDAMARSALEAEEAAIADDPDPMRIGKALQLQADAAMAKGDNEHALQLCVKALSPMEEAWAGQPVAEARSRLLSGIKAVCSQIIANLVALNARHPSESLALQAFDYAERSRARNLLLDIKECSLQLPAHRDRAQLDRESAIGRRILFFREGGEPDPDEAERIEAERTDLIARRIGTEGESADLSSPPVGKPVTADLIRREFFRSHPNAAILMYQLRPRDGILIVLTAESARLFVLPGWKTIGDAVSTFLAQVSARTPASQFSQASRRLYDMLLEPCASMIRGRELIIVPDHMLNGVPFEALALSAPPTPSDFRQLRYLVDEHPVTYAPSVSALVALEHRPPGRVVHKQLLLVGDPAVGIEPMTSMSSASTASGAVRSRSFARLSGANREISEIAHSASQLQWEADIRLGINANKPTLTEYGALLPYRVVHLATHALADQVEGGLSGVVLSVGPGGSGDDVYLTAEEISHLKLAADLVVLSGCSTGRGQVTNAEGVVGLGQAFLVAGARRVCTTLWNVSDEAPQQLMPAFYRQYFARDSEPAESLRAAKRELIRSGEPPSVWAAMILTGAPDNPH